MSYTDRKLVGFEKFKHAKNKSGTPIRDMSVDEILDFTSGKISSSLSGDKKGWKEFLDYYITYAEIMYDAEEIKEELLYLAHTGNIPPLTPENYAKAEIIAWLNIYEIMKRKGYTYNPDREWWEK